MLRRRVDHSRTRSYAEVFPPLGTGELLAEPPESWLLDWGLADADRFNP
jgi:hypothetical protein